VKTEKFKLEYTKDEIEDELRDLLGDEELKLLFRMQRKHEKYLAFLDILNKIQEKKEG
jgi:hypothetical protein